MTHVRAASAVLTLLALGLVFVSCTKEGGESLGEAGVAADVDRTIELEATEFSFSVDHIDVTVGETIEFVVTNVGHGRHEFSVGQSHIHRSGMEHGPGTGSTGTIAPGETGTLVWHFTRAGETAFACHIAGHDRQGMTGTLTVSD